MLLFPWKFTASIPPPKDATTNQHVFADASLKAYGAVAYLQQHQQSATLVMVKTTVAPLKQITLLKLELMAAVRLSDLITTSLNIVHVVRESNCIVLDCQPEEAEAIY